MNTKILLLILLSFLTSNTYAQLAMGKWRTHFAYNAIEQITQSDNKVFAVSDGSLFSIDKDVDCVNNDGCMEYYGKMTGLNDGSISRIGYDNFSKKLLIIYKNGNIDLLSNGGIINIPDLRNKQLSVSKSINDINFMEDKAYLSTNFGIVVLNTKKNEIADTYFIGPNGTDIKVLNTAIFGSKLYALTQNSLYIADVNEPNLVNYEYWSTLNNLPGSGDLKKIAIFSNKLILHRGDKLFTYNGTEGWQDVLSTINVSNASFSNGKMFIYSSAELMYTVDETFNTIPIDNLGEISDVTYDNPNGIYWMAAKSKGVLSLSENLNNKPLFFKPHGPALNNPWFMTFANEKLFIVPGGVWAKFDERNGYVMIFDEKKPDINKWTNISYETITKLTGIRFRDIVAVAVDPFDANHYFATSYQTGLYEFQDTTLVKWHNATNSPLNDLGGMTYHMTDGIKFDAQGNLWCLNSNSPRGIHVLKKDGSWKSYDYAAAKSQPNMKSILISNQNPNQKWINMSRYAPGLLIFDDKGTLDDLADDENTFISSFKNTDNEGARISPAYFYCLAQDKNGVIWCGTEQGPLLFYNTSKAFETDYTCSRVKIPRNDDTGLADYLLESEKVKTIAIDGANRKWIGTENSGAYLMSENGQETIEHFTAANSPLLSNDVLSIAINPITGEVFFGTGNGVVSYQSNASEPNDTFTNVHAYPNPVRESYNGIITITGLVKDTQVRITDLNGNLVCKTISNGSIATWDGKNVNGKKVGTGIYLVICVNEDGTQSTATKIMVIN